MVQSQMPLYPEQASNFAPQVDNLVYFMLAVCVFFAVVICAAVIYFIFKYQRKAPDEIGAAIHGDLRLEIAWIVLPFPLLLVMFGWGAAIYVDYRHTPMDTLDVYVIGKQWMWKLQQPDGRKEINELHVPVGRNVRLNYGQRGCYPRFFRAFVPGENGCGARTLQHHVVPADQGWEISFFLLAVIAGLIMRSWAVG